MHAAPNDNSPATAFEEAMAVIQSEYFKAMKLKEVLLNNIAPSDQTPPAHRVAREPRIRASIDDACMAFARTRGWPQMDPDTAVFLYDRFEAAYRCV